MGKVILEMSMSLDGFVAASNRRPEEPMGEGGPRLHEWVFGDTERDREVIERSISEAGAPTTTPSRGGEPTARRARDGFRCSSSRTMRPSRAPKAASTRS